MNSSGQMHQYHTGMKLNNATWEPLIKKKKDIHKACSFCLCSKTWLQVGSVFDKRDSI